MGYGGPIRPRADAGDGVRYTLAMDHARGTGSARIEQWGDQLVIPLTRNLAEALGAKPGDTVAIATVGGGSEAAEAHGSLVEQVARFRWPVEPGWRFDRDEATAR